MSGTPTPPPPGAPAPPDAPPAGPRSGADDSRVMRLVLEAIPDLVVYYDTPELTIRWANRAAGRSLDQPAEALCGQTCHRLWAERDTPCPDCPVRACFESGQPEEAEQTTRDGRIWQLRAFPVGEAEGGPAGVVELGRDVSQTRWLARALNTSLSNLRAFFTLTQDYLMVLDDTGRIVEINAAVLKGLGYRRDQMIDRPVFDLLPHSRRAEARRTLEQVLAGHCDSCTYPVLTADGRPIPIETRIARGTWNGRAALFTSSRDLSELTFQRDLFEAVFRLNSSLMALSDPETGRFIDVNQAFLETLGLTRDEVVGRTSVDLGLVPDEARRRAILDQALDPARKAPLEIRHLDRQGRPLIGEMRMVRIHGAETDTLLSMLTDVTAQRQAMHRLEHQATHDPLTGLFNRQHGQRVLAEETRRAQRLGHPLSLVMIDIDHFKAVNDRFGHPVGDQVLREIARRLAERLRETDILSRWGGEEFLLLLPGSDGLGAHRLAETLRHAVGDSPFPEVGAVTLSLGVAACRPGESDAATLARADTALYQAKAAGRDRTIAL